MICADMLLQGSFPGVGFATVTAHVGFFQRAHVRFQMLLEVVVQLEAAVALATAEQVVYLGNLDLDDFNILQHFGGSYRFLLVHYLLPTQIKENTDYTKMKIS